MRYFEKQSGIPELFRKGLAKTAPSVETAENFLTSFKVPNIGKKTALWNNSRARKLLSKGFEATHFLPDAQAHSYLNHLDDYANMLKSTRTPMNVLKGSALRLGTLATRIGYGAALGH